MMRQQIAYIPIKKRIYFLYYNSWLQGSRTCAIFTLMRCKSILHKMIHTPAVENKEKNVFNACRQVARGLANVQLYMDVHCPQLLL